MEKKTNRHDSDSFIYKGHVVKDVAIIHGLYGQTAIQFYLLTPDGCKSGFHVISEDELIEDYIDKEFFNEGYTVEDMLDELSREAEEDEFDYYQEQIKFTCDDIKGLLLSKNAKYGNAMFNPISIFGQNIPAETAILARLHDKLSRLDTIGLYGDSEDVITDLIGYLVGLKIVLDNKG